MLSTVLTPPPQSLNQPASVPTLQVKNRFRASVSGPSNQKYQPECGGYMAALMFSKWSNSIARPLTNAFSAADVIVAR